MMKKNENLNRFLYSFGPILGGILLDAMDFVTYGPIGIYIGFIVGFIISYFISSIYKLNLKKKIIISIFSGIYCMLPLTEFIPLATIIGGIARYNRDN